MNSNIHFYIRPTIAHLTWQWQARRRAFNTSLRLTFSSLNLAMTASPNPRLSRISFICLRMDYYSKSDISPRALHCIQRGKYREIEGFAAHLFILAVAITTSHLTCRFCLVSKVPSEMRDSNLEETPERAEV